MSENPRRTPINALSEAWAKWISGSERGLAVGRFASRSIALPQLKRLASGTIPWAPLQKPVRDAKVVLISTGGVHLRNDRPFNVNGPAGFEPARDQL